MLTIRLARKGKKNQPFFRVVVTDRRRSSNGGRAVEEVGYVDPLTKRRSLKKERILHWIKNGARPSDTVHNLLIAEKIIEGKKIHVARVKKSVASAPESAAGAAASAPAAPTEPSAPEKPVEAPKEEPKPAEEALKLEEKTPEEKP